MSPPQSARPERFEELLRAARGGSADALGELLNQYRALLQRLANEELDPVLQAKAGGSDLVQQSFLEASVAFPQFVGAGPEEWVDWLAGILRNNAHDLRRRYRDAEKRAVHREVPAGSPSGNGEAQLPAAEPSPSEHAVRREREQMLAVALARLSPQQQEIIRLRQQEGLTFVEIGTRMGCTDEAARKQWARAIEELRDLLRGVHGSST